MNPDKRYHPDGKGFYAGRQPLALSPLYNRHVLKHKDAFGVFDVAGNVMNDPGNFTGLFIRDMRHLSEWRLSLADARLKLLSSSLDDEGVLLESNLTNTTFCDQRGEEISEAFVYIRREKIIFEEVLLENVKLFNYGNNRLVLKLILEFDADFLDIFEVRGVQRDKKGKILPPEFGKKQVVFKYKGIDDFERETRIGFSKKPDEVDGKQALFNVNLKPGDCWSAVFSAGVCKNDTTEKDFDRAVSRLKSNYKELCKGWVDVRTNNERFNSWLDSSRKALRLLITDTGEGLYPYAGIPWFSTVFGRDGIITALQTLFYHPPVARGVLQYLSRHQAKDYDSFAESAPGKIMHEKRAGEAVMTGETPFSRYYGSVDSTPLFLMLAAAYFQRTRDMEFIKEIWPSLRAAVDWIGSSGDVDGDGLVEYSGGREGGFNTDGWKNSFNSVFHHTGESARPPVALCEVQGYVYAAYRGMSRLAWVMGDNAYAEQLAGKAEALYELFNGLFWMDDMGTFALALDKNKKPCRVRTSNPGHLLYCGIVPEDRAEKLVKMLMSEEMFTGWGIRTVSSNETLYNPVSYHNGSVWPHDTGICAAGFARYGYFREAEKILQSLFEASRYCPHRVLPELFCGFDRQEDRGIVFFPAACSPQAWAAGAVFMALEAAMGLEQTGDEGFKIANNRSSLFSKLQIAAGEEDGASIFSVVPWEKNRE